MEMLPTSYNRVLLRHTKRRLRAQFRNWNWLAVQTTVLFGATVLFGIIVARLVGLATEGVVFNFSILCLVGVPFSFGVMLVLNLVWAMARAMRDFDRQQQKRAALRERTCSTLREKDAQE